MSETHKSGTKNCAYSPVVLDIEGASQNNLKNIDLRLPLNELTVITGVSGSGKSSLAFDTIYAEGQRRYVETFSPYARQFLDRMDRPNVKRIDGVPPAIAIDQVNPVRTSRSTVGTMTELNDLLKLLFARFASIYCSQCGDAVVQQNSEQICSVVLNRFEEKSGQTIPFVMVAFSLPVPDGVEREFIVDELRKQGYKNIVDIGDDALTVVQDRLRPTFENRSRLAEAIEIALENGDNTVLIQPLDDLRKPKGEILRFSNRLRCDRCNIDYSQATENLFSFNSPVGACEYCRGFGRIKGIDYDLVIPDKTRSLEQGAIRPLTSDTYIDDMLAMLDMANKRGIATTTPWQYMCEEDRNWVIEGDEDYSEQDSWHGTKWYGMKRFFAWEEQRSYKMHMRIFLSHYRGYSICPDCSGSRLKPQAFLWRIGNQAMPQLATFRHPSFSIPKRVYRNLPGLTICDVATLSLSDLQDFFHKFAVPYRHDAAAAQLLDEIAARVGYLNKVGLGYLNLDRQSRTLSGGEVQRINLTTALGTTLVNTLFVLDEPTIGLHTRDVARVADILSRLRDAGNSLLVVEHDEQIIRAADRLLDIGPGPGANGGNLVHFGSFEQLLENTDSVTGDCLKNHAYLPKFDLLSVDDDTSWLNYQGVGHNNLKDIDVSIPLSRLVCVTGVSGSGKSSLVNEVIYRAILRKLGEPTQPPGDYSSFELDASISDAVLVDQSPIGKSARSNPVTYIGALTRIRERLAAVHLAKQRGYTPGHFSFNSPLGRCIECAGTGFEHVEMQFLSDVYLRCPKCDGTRYRAEVQDVKTAPAPQCSSESKSIVEILDMTVSQAVEFFADDPRIVAAFKPLEDVGLEYLKLGQPVPTLSGGEAQRLKLAMHIVNSEKRARSKRSWKVLYFFDEPTTGLHFTDVAKLISALRKLIEVGNSVIVIEHNLDLINSADWIIDLGPEGGDAGGEIVAQGPPQAITKVENSYTGQALQKYRQSRFKHSSNVSGAANTTAQNSAIRVLNAREHNLRNLCVDIPYRKFSVITGLSGSGKSTLAFDILFKEGQRRYLETLNAYSRQFVQPATRADFDAVTGLPPTVAIEQRMSRGGYKSTVATLTECYHYIRLLFTRFGTQHCPDCKVKVQSRSVEALIERIWKKYSGTHILVMSPLVLAKKGYYHDLAQWAADKGANYLLVDGSWASTANWPWLDRYREHEIVMPLDSVKLISSNYTRFQSVIYDAARLTGGYFHITQAHIGDDMSDAVIENYSVKRECPRCHRAFKELDPREFSFNSPIGWCTRCNGVGLEPSSDGPSEEAEIDCDTDDQRLCKSCNGNRLNPQSLAVRFNTKTIDKIVGMSIEKAHSFFQTMETNLSQRERDAMGVIFSELNSRLEFLQSVGLSYLSLDRSAPTLSGGEAQRIRLASQLGSGLSGACYILDEPTIGLHPRDNRRLLSALADLKDKGNTVVVVEHDEETIRSADHIIDLGPGGGANGGSVVASGTVEEILNNPHSATGRSLSNPLSHPLPRQRPKPDVIHALKVSGARIHNLRNIDVLFPVGQLICVTGVSGSGKSTLITDVVYKNMKNLLSKSSSNEVSFADCSSIDGFEAFRSVLKVDQTPIGRTPRSCPVTYIKVWDRIRKLFAETPESRIRGYDQSRYSFNVVHGRCQECGGQGEQKIEMNFLPDVRVRCEACAGNRFNSETLAVKFHDKSIADVLNMSAEEAADFFSFSPSLRQVFELLVNVGLGYLRLGQTSPSLSGGEAQRIKLVSELSKAITRFNSSPGRQNQPVRAQRGTLYVLDEPTVGLHSADVEKLLSVIHALVDAGNTVVVVEHNLDFIAEADWIVDLGPEGGTRGGKVVVQGELQKVRKSRRSHTAEALRKHLNHRAGSLQRAKA